MTNEATSTATEVEQAVKAAKDSRNGVTRPNPGTILRKIWDLADNLSNQKKAPVSRGELLAATDPAGYNSATVATQYGRWKEYNGLKGVTIANPASAEKAAAKETKAAEKAAKAAEKAAKAAEKAAAKATKAKATEGAGAPEGNDPV